jgi:hypothetical protein
VNDNQLGQLYEIFKYGGFDRETVIEELYAAIPDPSIAVQAVILCALRGPKKAVDIPLTNGKTLRSYGIPSSGAKGSKGLSCNRITAATADLAAFHLKRLKIPKRINMECPAWLQFPSAGSITLPADLRAAHKEFSSRFSKQIGGEFSDIIYEQMVMNSYYNAKLSLF